MNLMPHYDQVLEWYVFAFLCSLDISSCTLHTRATDGKGCTISKWPLLIRFFPSNFAQVLQLVGVGLKRKRTRKG
jgi:hypothetical protein